MKPNTIVLLQSIGVTVQTINAGIATVLHEPIVTLIVAGVAAGYQFFVAHLGNEMDPKNVDLQQH